MRQLGRGTMDRRRFLWDWIDERYPEAFMDPGYPMLKSPALRAEATAALAAHFELTTRQASQHRLGKAVCRWLDDPDTFSPHVDGIALELAQGFNWGAFAALTLAEFDVLLDQLSTMRDPFDVSTEVRTTDGYGGASLLIDASGRRLAFLTGTPEQRNHLAGALYVRKRDRAVAVAA